MFWWDLLSEKEYEAYEQSLEWAVIEEQREEAAKQMEAVLREYEREDLEECLEEDCMDAWFNRECEGWCLNCCLREKYLGLYVAPSNASESV